MSRRIQSNPRARVESGQWRSVPRPVDWPARVEAVLERDQSCRWQISADPRALCGSADHLEVDHIGDPADHDLANLQALCAAHHKRKTAQQAAAGRQRRSRKRPPEPHPGLITDERHRE